MTWNYRLVRYRTSNAIGLHEVYYNKAGEPIAMTAEPCSFVSDYYADDGSVTARDDVISAIARALNDAINRPILLEPEPGSWGKPDESELDAQ